AKPQNRKYAILRGMSALHRLSRTCQMSDRRCQHSRPRYLLLKVTQSLRRSRSPQYRPAAPSGMPCETLSASWLVAVSIAR
ncbi:unnamed protein product, partial [Symbiodinium necroappetens]